MKVLIAKKVKIRNKTFDWTGKIRNVVKLCSEPQYVTNRVPTPTNNVGSIGT